MNQTTNYYYDCNGNLVSKTSETIDSEGSVKLVQNISLDENGNTIEQTNINNRYKTIKRGTDDNDDEFVEYISGDGNTPRNVKVSSNNDDFGRLDNVSTQFNGEELFATEYDYETTSHKTTSDVSSILYDYDNKTKGLMYQYTYDANGNIATSVERSYDKGTGGVPINSSYSKSSYTYDNLNQLTQITDDSQKEKTKISYDNAGNIKKVQVYNSSTNALKKTNTYGYDTTWKDKLTSYNGETITYDGIGNPLKYRNGMTMQWKNGRQLSQVKTPKDTITYKYNIKGLRTRKYNSDYTYYYYYDDNNNLIAMMQGGVVAYFYYDSNNSVTAMSINDSMYYYVKNLQGDITKIVNHQGKVMVEYTYDAWGNILKEKSNVSPSYATVKDFNPFRYRGYVYDTDTGLYYLQSRYYDPKTGRFINADDTAYVDTNSGTPLSTNMFAYCENNQVNRLDKTGYFFVVDDILYAMYIASLVGTFILVCVSIVSLCIKIMNEMEFKSSWKSFCKRNGYSDLISIGSTIWSNHNASENWSEKKLKRSTKAAKKYLAEKKEIEKAKSKIPNKLKTKNGKVDISKFKGKGPKLPKGGRGKLSPLKWYISKDYDNHKGSVWKLFNKSGKRIASLSGDGTVVGK